MSEFPKHLYAAEFKVPDHHYAIEYMMEIYHARTELFDKLVCHAVDANGYALPIMAHERRQSNEYAMAFWKCIADRFQCVDGASRALHHTSNWVTRRMPEKFDRDALRMMHARAQVRLARLAGGCFSVGLTMLHFGRCDTVSHQEAVTLAYEFGPSAEHIKAILNEKIPEVHFHALPMGRHRRRFDLDLFHLFGTY